MSYSTNVPTFKGVALNTVLIGSLRRDYEKRQYAKKQREQQMLNNQAQYQQYQQMMQAYYLPSVPTLSPRLTQDTIRFGGNGESRPVDDPDFTEIGVETMVGLAVDRGARSIFASDAKYKKVNSYIELPVAIKNGISKLETSKLATDKNYYYSEAEKDFIEGVNTAKTYTMKSYSYRLAAIAANLRGDKGAAKNYQRKAVEARKEAAAGLRHDYPASDINTIDNACLDFSTEATSLAKSMLLLPVLVFSDKAADAAFNKMAPYTARIHEVKGEVTEHWRSIKNGEESDDEWIEGRKSNVRNLNGKGLRHKFL